MNIQSVILAAGQGVRMRSKTPKVLHPVLGKPMLWYALQAAAQITDQKPVVVVGHGAADVMAAVGEGARFVMQEEQLGTGHAVMQAAPLLRDADGLVLVTYGDMPLLRGSTLSRLVALHREHDTPITMLTTISDDPRGFGRIIRAADGSVEAIVEEAQADEQQLKINELNVGVYCFRSAWLWQALERIPLSPKGEYYLTDAVAIAVSDGYRVHAVTLDDPSENIGVNTRVHLAEVETAMRQRINRQWMLSGVTFLDPATTYIEPEVSIGQDTVIQPNTILRGKTSLGRECVVGPNTVIDSSRVGDRTVVFASILEHAVVEEDVDIGPYAHLRKGAHLARGVHMGNFGEVKQSYLGPGTKMGHFSYIGDANIGADVNIGCGTITCNFDGEKKHRTEIGDGVFLGSDTMLVAPVKLGEGARTGAGAVVTKDVPDHQLVVGVPAHLVRTVPHNQNQRE